MSIDVVLAFNLGSLLGVVVGAGLVLASVWFESRRR